MSITLIKKIVRDLWLHKGRSILVILSISIGIIGVGSTVLGEHALSTNIETVYNFANSSSGTIISDPFNRDILLEIENMPGVSVVEGRTTFVTKLSHTNSLKEIGRDVQVLAIPDYHRIKLDKIMYSKGTVPPQHGQIVIEKSALSFLNVQIGDTVWMKGVNDKKIPLIITGTVLDAIRQPSHISGIGNVYISFSNLQELGYERNYNSVSFKVADDVHNINHILEVSSKIREKLRNQDLKIHNTIIPKPGEHWSYDIVQSINVVLMTLGILTVVLAISLIINMVLSTIIGQYRQIGIIKVIGATPLTLVIKYLLMIVIYGLFALLIGVPLAFMGANIISFYFLGGLYIDYDPLRITENFIVTVLVLAIVIPMIIAIFPIFKSIRITEREAIHYTGMNVSQKNEWLTKMLSSIRGLPLMLTD